MEIGEVVEALKTLKVRLGVVNKIPDKVVERLNILLATLQS